MATCVACLTIVVAISAAVGNWSSFSSWLSSNSQALVGIAAIATSAAAIVGALGLLFAAIGAFAVRNQVVLQRKIAYEQSSRECLWRFTDQWRGDIAKKGSDGTSPYTRALKVLEAASWKRDVGNPELIGAADEDVVEVLNFFDGIAYMRRRGDMDQELAWNAFCSDALAFYEVSGDFLSAYRLGTISRKTRTIEQTPISVDVTVWEDFDWWAQDLNECETRKQAAAAQRAQQS